MWRHLIGSLCRPAEEREKQEASLSYISCTYCTFSHEVISIIMTFSLQHDLILTHHVSDYLLVDVNT